MRGYTTFCLEFHLAHLILREVKESPDSTTDQPVEARNAVADLSFLATSPPSEDSPNYAIYQAHISVVICGWTNTNWTGYAFVNTGLKEEPYQEFAEDEQKHDLFAADKEEDFASDADLPIWDARRYWLRIVSIRCQLVVREWNYLVNTVEEGVKSRVRVIPIQERLS
jgi:hypothetical protein